MPLAQASEALRQIRPEFYVIFALAFIAQFVLAVLILFGMRDLDRRIKKIRNQEQLDSHYYDSAYYQALRRIGFAAPLLGVFITAFLFVTQSEGQVVGDSIKLPDLRILFGGVLVGAAIAITNQFFLWFCDIFYTKLKRSYEAAQNERSQSDMASETESASILKNLVAGVSEKVNQASQESADFISNLNVQLQYGTKLLKNNMKLSSQLGDTTKRFSQSFAEQSAAINTNIDVLVQAYAKNQSDFTNLAEELRASSRAALDVQSDALERVAKFEEIGDAISGSAADVSKSVGGLSNETQKMGASVRDYLVELEQSTNDVIKRLGTLGQTIDRLPDIMNGSASAITDVSSKMSIASTAFESNISHLQQSSKSQADMARSLKDAAGEVKEGANSLNSTFKSVDQSNLKLKQSIEDLLTASKALSSQLDDQRKILKQWPEFTEKILESMQIHFDNKIGEMSSVLTTLIQKTAMSSNKTSV